MPQITLEQTSNIKIPVDHRALLSDLHTLLSAKGEIDIENCKSRVIIHDTFLIGTGGDHKAFVHLEILILSGRDITLKQLLGQHALEVLKKFYQEALHSLEIQFTVRVEDLQRETYAKYVNS